MRAALDRCAGLVNARPCSTQRRTSLHPPTTRQNIRRVVSPSCILSDPIPQIARELTAGSGPEREPVAAGAAAGQVAGVAGPPVGDGNELPAQGGDHGLTEDASIAFDDPELAIPRPYRRSFSQDF